MYKTRSTLLSTQTPSFLFFPQHSFARKTMTALYVLLHAQESCFILSDVLCPRYERCQFSSGDMQNESVSIKPEQCDFLCGHGCEMSSHAFS